jgi:flavin reductase (DIM6/NTAB) family NADH-FMN oxidoreductase RutF
MTGYDSTTGRLTGPSIIHRAVSHDWKATELQTAESINELYRDAWSKFATGVTVITTVEPGGEVHGMTASSVASVSLDPPLVLVVIGEERQTHGLIESTGRFGMSILDTGQTDIAKHFATPPETRGDIDAGLIMTLSDTPVVGGAIAAMSCRVSAAHKAGDHTVFIAEVESIAVGKGEPLVWFQRQFGGFAEGN